MSRYVRRALRWHCHQRILADPNGASNFDTDGNGTAQGGDEFIELLNTSSTAIDISGVELWDAGRDNWFTFPSGTILQPGATAVVVRDVQDGGNLPNLTGNNLAFDANYTGNVFNNGGDNFVVYDPSADEFIQATFNGATLDDPTATSSNDYVGFSPTATRVGSGEDFGADQDGISIQRTPTGFVNDATPTPGAENVCFASGTRIATPDGFRAIEDLEPGDRICTSRSGPQPIRWVFSRDVAHAELLAHPNLRPIRVSNEGALRVSRQHRLLVTGRIAQRMFDETDVLVPAKDLLEHEDCTIDFEIRDLQYFHLLLDGHHIINANGIAAETLYLGREGVHAMSPDARRELEQIYPGISNVESFLPPPLCRTSVSGRRAKRMVERHSKNRRQLLTAF